MHPNTTQDRFIELRAQGLSLSRIADQLAVSKRTLIDWSRERRGEISSLRALELEALHEKVLASHEQELTFLATWQRKLDSELASRPIETLPTEKLLRLSLLLRREIRDLCKPASPTGIQNPESSVQDPGPVPSSPIKPDQADPIFLPVDALEPTAPETGSSIENQNSLPRETASSPVSHGANPQTPQLPNSSHTLPPPGDQSSPIKVDQADPGFPPAHAPPPALPETDSTVENQNSLPRETASSPVSHGAKIKNPEHCLHCGDPLPPILPDELRSPWCSACRSPICAPPGFSIRELCPGCGTPVPVHGYNIKRWLGKCAECGTILPNLVVNAPLKWLPPDSELQKLALASSS